MYQHKQSKHWLISRTGVEKVQYKHRIEVKFEAVRCEVDFAAVKATATREGVPPIQTFGSAAKVNCQVSYYLEMAEKRALSRAVLKLGGFYEQGAYGEDEMPPEKREKVEQAPEPMPKEDLIKLLQEAPDLDALKATWTAHAKPWKADSEVLHAKDSRKADLEATQV